MNIIDISMPIHENMQVFNNNISNRPKITNFSNGNIYESEIKMNLHTGTHIDFPLHMIPGGETSDSLDISKFITDCFVLDFSDVDDKITDVHLKGKKIEPDSFILLKTKNSLIDTFDMNFVFVDAKGAAYLKEQRIKGVGIDSLGIERSQAGFDTHKTLMQNGIAILEGLRLGNVAEGKYKMIALPLHINNVEALPARVILTDIDS